MLKIDGLLCYDILTWKLKDRNSGARRRYVVRRIQETEYRTEKIKFLVYVV
jgi:hypothetical protein